jgi:hypothetical protein
VVSVNASNVNLVKKLSLLELQAKMIAII